MTLGRARIGSRSPLVGQLAERSVAAALLGSQGGALAVCEGLRGEARDLVKDLDLVE